ncbi:MAG: hypothetical protein ACRD5E_13280 [Nitrososphaeraceae archaeon]
MIELHRYYLQDNRFDEGDLIYYRINYRLEALFGITKEEAQSFHAAYHRDIPRTISKGYCHICDAIVKFIPIIYGSSERERKSLEMAQNEGKLIIANLGYNAIKEGVKLPLYGCQICKAALPRYGTMP